MVDKNYCMSSYTAFRYIERDDMDFYPGMHHENIKQIPNEAPSLEQYWEELKVYKPELEDGNEDPMKREPKESFFTNVNINFASSQLSRRKKKPYKATDTPVYYYHINPETNEVEHLSLNDAKKYYCKLYEQTTLWPKSESLKCFQYLLTLCKNRDEDLPIIIRSHDVVDSPLHPVNIEEEYHDAKKAFGCGYCLAEMLIHYPKLEECIWNRESSSNDSTA